MIQQIKPSIRAKAIRQISKATYGFLTGACCLLANNNAFTQTVAANASQQQNPTPLKSFLGYYQLPNKVAFIAFDEQDNSLYATQLWDQKKRYQLVRKDDTHFESKNEGYTIEFLKNSSGDFSQTKILGRIVCERVPFDPTKIITLTASQLKKLAGTYRMANDNNFKIIIEPSEQGLILKQLWDSKTISFTPRAELFFLNEDGTFPLTFSVSNGKVEQMTCFEKDLWLKTD
ncbi:hypothetical protein [Sphingobacterium thalpophilum]|uniref:Domain of uncharacterized function (DUF3471) n=1 Tax=Sphingobacterium thalpophilum TaxID=259 RepID=A0A4U9U7K3_9SPHI|nr:hypothetical protein [Sphingobacterium thalpophilum]VTR28157.1 Domain of uncharacterised function (DUF3471) [Sphingobacterium thalpophilum]